MKGLDLSPNEIDEARRRYEELIAKRPSALSSASRFHLLHAIVSTIFLHEDGA